MAPFTLDEPRATDWITQLICTAELPDLLDGAPPLTTRTPRIGMAWTPQDPGEEDTPHLLVSAAQQLGILNGPRATTLDYLYVDDGDQGHYLWLLDLTLPNPLKLITEVEPITELGTGTTHGFEAAIAILREATEAANLLLHQLHDHLTARTPHTPPNP